MPDVELVERVQELERELLNKDREHEHEKRLLLEKLAEAQQPRVLHEPGQIVLD